jgi:hypothetical protein
MALITEDGSGLPDANAYVDGTYVESYLLGDQREAFTVLSGPEKEVAIIRATRFIDYAFTWLGTRKTLEQGLLWPRTGVKLDGFPLEGVPAQVKKAAAEAVWLAIEGEEFFATDSDAEVSSEQVDVIKVSYREPGTGGQKAASRFDVLNKLLRGMYKADTASGSGGVTNARVRRV